jgi:hypothetical protein
MYSAALYFIIANTLFQKKLTIVEANRLTNNHSKFICVGYFLVILRECNDAYPTKANARIGKF